MNTEMEQLKAANKAMKEENSRLRHQVSGSKGRNKQLAKEIKHLKEDITARDSVIKTMHHNLSEKMHKNEVLSLRDFDYRAMIEWYNDLPWYKKIFISRLETYGD